MSGPRGTSLRPTSDKVREALFSILGTRVAGRRFLDLYAGTGAVGIEALSRGAQAVTFVELHASAVALLRKNLTACDLMARAHVCAVATEAFLKRASWWNAPYHIVFADPPYSAGEQLHVLSALEQPGLIAPNGLIVIEQASNGASPGRVGPATFRKRYEYGDTALVLYACQADSEEA